MPLFLLEPFLTLWVGKIYSSDYLSKVAFAGTILLIGQYIMDSSACSSQMTTGMGRVAFLSKVTLCWAVGGLVCVWVYLHWFNGSIIGVSLIIAIARVIGSFVNLVYGIKVIGIATKGFLINSLMKPTIVSMAVCGVGYGLVRVINVYKIPEFILAVMILGILYIIITWFFIFSTEEKNEALRWLANIRKCDEKFAVNRC